MNTLKILAITAVTGLIPSITFASCGASFCTANSNWTSESALLEPGSLLDVRYEYIKQDQPRTGSRRIGVGQIHRHHDEVSTTNHNLLLTYSHTFDSAWGLAVTAPLVDRRHFHIYHHYGEQLDERWSMRDLGDVRLNARYQLPYLGDPSRPGTTGLILGVKLPTGRTDVANGHGDVAERTLQPGSGTTDVILGAYYPQQLPQLQSSWFAQTQFQQAISEHHGFKPGHQFGLDAGYRYGVTDRLGLMAQLNYLAKGRDSGREAEPQDSGGRYVSISPGLGYAVSRHVQLYAFYQKPIYQYVNGVQLTAEQSFVAGISSRF